MGRSSGSGARRRGRHRLPEDAARRRGAKPQRAARSSRDRTARLRISWSASGASRPCEPSPVCAVPAGRSEATDPAVGRRAVGERSASGAGVAARSTAGPIAERGDPRPGARPHAATLHRGSGPAEAIAASEGAMGAAAAARPLQRQTQVPQDRRGSVPGSSQNAALDAGGAGSSGSASSGAGGCRTTWRASLRQPGSKDARPAHARQSPACASPERATRAVTARLTHTVTRASVESGAWRGASCARRRRALSQSVRLGVASPASLEIARRPVAQDAAFDTR